MRENRKSRISRAAAVILSVVTAAVMMPALLLPLGVLPAPACAESVTDTITIKVGYWGMSEEDYVEKATFHWTELDDAYGGALQTHEEAYSYFRDAEDGTYSTVVVSARGFYLEDLLNYAGVNLSDIENISFYTLDHDYGAFTSFTYAQLLQEPRYYFDDLPSKIRNTYNAAGILTGYELDDSVWDNKTRVQTMLALESSWAQYDAGTEHAFPSFENMGTGTRFRLLFGQTEPGEARTNQSAKYVHTVALTIPGAPGIKANKDTVLSSSGKILLSNRIGSHRVTFDVASDSAMLDSIMNNLTWDSSDDTVMRIDNVAMNPSKQYNDAVTVVIDYEVLKEGEATLLGNYMGSVALETGKQLDYADEDDQPKQSGKSDKDKDSGKKSNGSKTKASSGNSPSGSTAPTAAAPQKPRNLSLVQSGGTVTNPTPVPAAPEEASAELVSMDLEDVFAPQEQAVITPKDDSKKYAPFIFGGAGSILALGCAASALQFQGQTGGLSLRLRRKS